MIFISKEKICCLLYIDYLYIDHCCMYIKIFFKKFRKSFTLIELSIVLFVLSLLITLTLTGEKLINSAKAARIMKDISNYRQAINQFYQTYNVLPGDYNNAQYKFAPSGYTTMPLSNIATLGKDVADKIPLNGNYDGVVGGMINGLSFFHYSEIYGVWSHLSASHLIDKRYSNTCYDIAYGERSKCNKAGYNLPSIPGGYNNDSTFLFYSSQFGVYDIRLYGIIEDQIKQQGEFAAYNMLLLIDNTRGYTYNGGSSIDNNVAFGTGGGVSSDVMMIIDIKMDDGKPLTGQVFGINGGSKNSINNNVKDGQCNTYNGYNNYFNGSNYSSVAYTNDSNKSCIGIILFNELNG